MPESVHAQGFEPHDAASNSKLNWLRAGVLGVNDGLVSTASLMVGVAVASSSFDNAQTVIICPARRQLQYQLAGIGLQIDVCRLWRYGCNFRLLP